MLSLRIMESPLGSVAVVDDGSRVQMLDFVDDEAAFEARRARRFGAEAVTKQATHGPFTKAIRDYFDGRIDALESIPVLTGGTPFQERVWAALRTIGPGRTRSYGALAKSIENPKASRAVGLANGRNPVALIVPCHRVIGANGSLVGYAGGTWRKEWLLCHEGAHLV